MQLSIAIASLLVFATTCSARATRIKQTVNSQPCPGHGICSFPMSLDSSSPGVKCCASSLIPTTPVLTSAFRTVMNYNNSPVIQMKCQDNEIMYSVDMLRLTSAQCARTSLKESKPLSISTGVEQYTFNCNWGVKEINAYKVGRKIQITGLKCANAPIIPDNRRNGLQPIDAEQGSVVVSDGKPKTVTKNFMR